MQVTANQQVIKFCFRLRALHYEANQQLKDLLRQQLTLQEDIKVKENTIFIGEYRLVFSSKLTLFKKTRLDVWYNANQLTFNTFNPLS